MDRLSKNKQIAQTMRETYAKRKTQICKCFKFKVDKSSLSAMQKEQLKMIFVEAKWIYNYLLDKDIYSIGHKDLDIITHKDQYKNDVVTKLSYIKSSIKQSLIQQIIDQIKGLNKLKQHGYEVGSLKYKSEFNSINLKQFGVTHKFNGNKIKIQGIKKPLKVYGLEQLNKYDKSKIEYANAKLLYDGIDYFIALTCYIDNEYLNKDKTYKYKIVGIDMGVHTSVTLSDGSKYNICVEESERLKHLQRKLARQKKGSNNKYKTIKKLRKEYIHITNKKHDLANKLVHKILSENALVIMQDEQIAGWKKLKDSCPKIQHSALGTIKMKLKASPQVVVLDKYFPTTKMCFNCRNKHEEITLNDRIFICPTCGTMEDRDVHAANNMLIFYNEYMKLAKLDGSGTDHTSIIKPVRIAYNDYKNLYNKLSKQEDTTSSALC